jgi:hypothetical protein
MTAMSDDDDNDNDNDNGDDDDDDDNGYNDGGDSNGGGCPRLFQSTPALFDRVMGDAAYDQRHQNRARG